MRSLELYVWLAVFRHLRFLFGGLRLDTNLAKAVTLCVGATSAECLPCSCGVSSEQPPLRPIGSSAGDGGSVVLISHLERAAEVVVDSRT